MNTAFQLAESWHRGQVRKGTSIPYISHLMAVSALVLEYGGTRDQAQAALLHDILEDTKLTYVELRHAVGEKVADIVRHCTHIDTPDEKTPEAWKARKQLYIDRLIRDGRPHDDEYVADFVLVTLADKTHNIETTLRDLESGIDDEEFFARFNVGRELQEWWYTSLLRAYLEIQVPSELVWRFRDAVCKVFPNNPEFQENAYDEM
jgi:(p)ppGpp synthase/HD superfamily hydrolase